MGQHYVEQDPIVVGALGVEEAVRAVVGDVHGVTFLTQRARERAAQIRFVFHDEDSHIGAVFPASVTKRPPEYRLIVSAIIFGASQAQP